VRDDPQKTDDLPAVEIYERWQPIAAPRIAEENFGEIFFERRPGWPAAPVKHLQLERRHFGDVRLFELLDFAQAASCVLV
jgi:hypothetical protein